MEEKEYKAKLKTLDKKIKHEVKAKLKVAVLEPTPSMVDENENKTEEPDDETLPP